MGISWRNRKIILTPHLLVDADTGADMARLLAMPPKEQRLAIPRTPRSRKRRS